MAIRFDIDKFNDVKDKYIKQLNGGLFCDTQYLKLFETYKQYLDNDDDVKQAKIAHKKKEKERQESKKIREVFVNVVEIANKVEEQERRKVHPKIPKVSTPPRDGYWEDGVFYVMRHRKKTAEKEIEPKIEEAEKPKVSPPKKKKPKTHFYHPVLTESTVMDEVQSVLERVTGRKVEQMRAKSDYERKSESCRAKIISIPMGGQYRRR